MLRMKYLGKCNMLQRLRSGRLMVRRRILPFTLSTRRQFHPGIVWPSSSTAFSSWQYPEYPWRRVSQEDVERAKRMVAMKRQRDELTRSVQSAVRVHLRQQFPKALALTTSHNIWKNFRTKQLNDNVLTLLELNGFQKVPLPQPMDMLMLAEGVVAFPNFYSRLARTQDQTKFLLYAQHIVEDPKSGGTEDKKHPDIIQEDIQLYRVLENQAEQLLNSVYNVVDGFLRIFIRQPIEMILQRIQRILDIARVRLYSGIEKEAPDTGPHPNIRLPSMVGSSPSSEPLENLIVMGQNRDELVWFTAMSASTRLVALPYVLGHKSASTLVSVSLVLFGALPLAYRSLNYAFLYPGLSEALAASVIGTISYGLWSQRYNARISQTQVVANALLHRVQARDDAVVLLLQEGAVQQVSQAVLAEYFDRLEIKSNLINRSRKDKDMLLPQVMPPKVSMASTDLFDPLDLAKKLGLLEAVYGSSGDSKPDWKAVALESASTKVQNFCKEEQTNAQQER